MPELVGPRVTVLGTGLMGAGVARSLRRAGLAVTVWNRSADKARPLAADGAVVADSIEAAVRDADIVLTTLFDVDAVLEVVEHLDGALPAGAIWLQASTIGLEGTERVTERAATQQVALVEAMMLGTRGPAESGQLVLLVAGDPALRSRLDPVLEAISSKVVWAGDTVGQATALKLVCNAWITAITAAVGQSLAMAGGLGLDPRLFLQAIDGGPTGSAYAQVKGNAMLDLGGEPQFALDGARKDLGLIADAAGRAGIDPVLIQAVRAVFDAAAARGHGDEDMAAVITGFRTDDAPAG